MMRFFGPFELVFSGKFGRVTCNVAYRSKFQEVMIMVATKRNLSFHPPQCYGGRVAKVGWVAVAAMTIFALAGGQSKAAQDSNRPVDKRPQQGVKAIFDIEYISGGHERNKLDLYLPQQDGGQKQKVGRLPLIIWVHGGAWMGGNKKDCPAVRFVQKGYAVASINYRLSQHAIFPAQIEDCKAAVRFLRANTDKYNLDPKRFGVWGASAGGHLVALLGTTGNVKEFDKGENLNVSSRVQAVCDYFGPTDFLKIGEFPSTIKHYDANSPESKLIGGAVLENKDACQRASPITYVTKDDPPFLIVHGDTDPLVPHNQSQLLYDALQKVKVEAKLHIVKGGGHGGFKDPAIEKMVDEFFDTHLMKRNPPQADKN